MTPDGGAPLHNQPVERFETPEVNPDDWERTIRQREMAEGMASPTPDQAVAQPRYTPSTATADLRDLSALPDRFTLAIERKGDAWKVTAPTVHHGLWKAGNDLPSTVNAALNALAEMVSLDGVAATPRRRTRK